MTRTLALVAGLCVVSVLPAAAQLTPVPGTPQHVVCDSGCGSPVATPDKGGFEEGGTSVTTTAGVYNDTLAALASGVSAAFRLTANRALHTNLRNVSGAEIGISGTPLFVTGAGATFPVTQATGTNLHMVCDSGCGGAASFADNAAFTFGTTSIGNIGFVVDDVSPNAVTENSAGTPRMSPSRIIYVDFSQTTANATAVKVDGSAVTQPVSAASLPLPSGAATGAKQDTGNTSVASIDTKTPALGQALAAGSVPVVLTASQLSTLTPLTTLPVTNTGTFAVQAAATLAAETTKVIGTVNVAAGQSITVTQATGTNLHTVVDSGSVTANAGTNLNTSALALEAGHLATIDTSTAKIPAQGQALAAASMPVVLTAAQVTTLTPPAALTNYALETGGNLASVKTNTDKLDILLSTLRDAINAQIALTQTSAASSTAPGKIDIAGGLSVDGTYQPLPLAANGAALLVRQSGPVGLPQQPCNPVRRVNCQPRTF